MRHKRKTRKNFLPFASALLLTVALCMLPAVQACGPAETDTVGSVAVPGDPANEFAEMYGIAFEMNDDMQSVSFLKKVDGDTAWFVLDGEEIKVRFLAVDTPETSNSRTKAQPWSSEASDYTTTRLANASEIYLEWDDGSDRTDKYDRYLAWIWVDGSLLQAELVGQGLAEVTYIYGDYKYTDALYDIQDSAKTAGTGIWSE